MCVVIQPARVTRHSYLTPWKAGRLFAHQPVLWSTIRHELFFRMCYIHSHIPCMITLRCCTQCVWDKLSGTNPAVP
jgi:hypothetical protein